MWLKITSLLVVALLFTNASAESTIIPRATIPSNNSQKLQTAIQQFRNDLERVKNLPISSLTTPCWKISRDSTYTKTWTFDDWENHQAHSLLRYARHVYTWSKSTTAQHIMSTITVVALWTILLFKATEFYALEVDNTKFAVTLGFIQAPILLLLTLKTNRALDRMLETRKAWGALSRTSRSLTGLVCAYIVPNDPDAGMLVARYAAFLGFALKAAFRRNDDDTDMIGALFQNFPAEKEWLLNSSAKRPIAISTRLRYMFAILGKDGGVSFPPILVSVVAFFLLQFHQLILATLAECWYFICFFFQLRS